MVPLDPCKSKGFSFLLGIGACCSGTRHITGWATSATAISASQRTQPSQRLCHHRIETPLKRQGEDSVAEERPAIRDKSWGHRFCLCSTRDPRARAGWRAL